MTRYLRALPIIALCWGALVSRGAAQPQAAHPRIWLTAELRDNWRDLAGRPDSAVSRAISKCETARDNPSEWSSGQYQGFAWVEALSACLVGWASTDDLTHRDTALLYLRALLSDRSEVGDGEGPTYADGAGIVAQDSGYSMRTHGVWSALGYDWLHGALTNEERDLAHERFTQWMAFHQQPDTYQRAQPGANYHAGHVLAVTLIAIAHADEMNVRQAGSGAALYDYVLEDMWGDVMAAGNAERGPLRGGDWLEGWQYAPLSVASYALGARALREQGVDLPWFAAWNDQVLQRYVHGLSPDDRMFVGGDTGDEEPLLSLNALPLWGVIAADSAASTTRAARGELVRLGSPSASDFQLFYEALAEGKVGDAEALDRTRLPTGFLAEGAGNFYGRTAFDGNAVWMVSQCKGSIVDHQHQNAGNVVLSRGKDDLLVDPGPYGSLSTLTGNAPTMSQPHFIDSYQPSQGAWGEASSGPVPEADATRFVYTRATRSNVLVTRCSWDGQLRFQDVPSSTVSDATRDVLLLPGTNGASLLLVDRVLTTPEWSDDASPLLLRFRSLANWSAAADGTSATATVGDSRLVVRRLLGAAETDARAVPQGDCQSSDRGKCDEGRFAAGEWRAEVPGPNPFAVHLLDADAATAEMPTASATSADNLTLIALEREARRFLVAVSRDASVISGYDTEATPSTHVVLDAPLAERVLVNASPGSEAGRCQISLSPAAADAGFASSPLTFNLAADCTVTEETEQAPLNPPVGETDGGVPGTGGGSGGDPGNMGGDASVDSDAGPTRVSGGGCGCQTVGGSTTLAWRALPWLLAGLTLRRRARRRRESGWLS